MTVACNPHGDRRRTFLLGNFWSVKSASMTNCPFWKCCRHELNIWNFSNPSWAQPVAEYPTIRRLAVTKDPEGPEPGVRTRSWPSSHFICSWTLARSCPCLGLSLPLCQKTGFGSIISFCPFLLPTPYVPALVPKPCLLCRAQFPAGNEKGEERRRLSW